MKVSKNEMRNIAFNRHFPVKLTATADFYGVSEKVKKRVHTALERGLIFAVRGEATTLYRMLALQYNVPFIQVQRHMSTRWQVPAWSFALLPGGDTSKLKQLATADDVACRMEQDEETKKRYQNMKRWHSSDYIMLCTLKDVKQLEQAVQHRMVGFEEQVRTAQEALRCNKPLVLEEE